MKDKAAFSQISLPSSLTSWPSYSDPNEIFFASELSTPKKREILSSWASDARTVSGAPTLRRLDNGVTVSIHDILEALKKLDASGPEDCRMRPEKPLEQRRRRALRKPLPAALRWRRRHDDDDDPPPCPAVIAPRPFHPVFGAERELEVA